MADENASRAEADGLSVTAVVAAAEFASHDPALGEGAASFMRRVYAEGLRRYRKRLEAVGLTGGEALLDAGSGFGQWSLSVADRYRRVVGVDVASARTAASQRMAAALNITNCEFLTAPLEAMPLPAAASFDAAVCYSVLNFTHIDRVMNEFARLLRPGAKLYLSANDVGRYLFDVINNRYRTADFNVRAYGLAAIGRTMLYRATGRHIVVGATALRASRIAKQLTNAGFTILASGPEGSLGATDTPWQRAHYGGFPCVFDILAQRR